MPWDFLAPMFVMLALIGALAWFATIYIRARQRSRELSTLSEFQTRLLDKLESGEALTAFMESKGGDRLMRTFRPPPASGLDRVLSAATAGLVMTSAGLAAIAIQVTQDIGGRGFAVTGILLTGLGLGFLLSAALSFVLARRYGTLYGGDEAARNGQP